MNSGGIYHYARDHIGVVSVLRVLFFDTAVYIDSVIIETPRNPSYLTSS